MGIRSLGGLVPGFSAAAPAGAFVSWADADQTISATTWSDIEFDTIVKHRGITYDTTNHEWTPLHSGLYIHNTQLKFNADVYPRIRFYDVDASAALFDMGPITNAGAHRSSWWQWQWWCDAGTTYTAQVYTSTASTMVADSYLMVGGPYVTEET